MADREIDNKKNPKKGVALDPNWEIINVGAAPNDGTGDPIRDAMVKVNKNFANIFSQDNKANTNAEYTWTNVHNFEANVYFNGNSTANIQFVTNNGEMDARFFTKRVYFGGGNTGLEGGQLTLGYKNDLPENRQGSWNIDVYGYTDANVSFQNALRIFNYDKNDTPHPFLHVNPVEGGTFADSANCIFSLSGYTDQIPFSVTFAKDIGPWEDKVQNFGSSSKKWNSVFAYNLYDVTNSKGVTGQVLSSTPEGIRWVNISGEKATQIIQQSFVGDGVTRNFTILGGYSPGLLNVFLNGIRMTPATDVDISLGTDIVFVDPPELGMAIDVSGALMLKVSVDSSLPYTWTANQEFTAGIIASGSIGRNGQILSSTGTTVKWIDYAPGPISPQGLVKANINQSFIGDGTTKTFTVTGGYTPGQLNVFLNGVRMSTTVEVDVSSGTVITFDSAPENKMPIDVVGALFSNTTVDTSVPYSWTANQDFKSNVSIVGLRANGSLGSAGQVLTTNGSGTYWAAGGGGGGSVNTDAQYTWTNTHTFTGTANVNIVATGTNQQSLLRMNSSNGSAFSMISARFNGVPDANNYGAFATQTDRTFALYSTNANGAPRPIWAVRTNADATVPPDFEGNSSVTDKLGCGFFIDSPVVLRNGIVPYGSGSKGNNGQILASTGNTFPGIKWIDAAAASVNTDAQYTWNNTHTFSSNATYFTKAGVTIGLANGGIPNITLGNTVGWYVDASNTFSAIGTTRSQLIMENPASAPGKIGIGSASVLADLNLSKGILANNTLGTAGQVLTTNGSASYWAAGGGGSVNTAAQYTWTNTHTFTTDIRIDGIIANNSTGTVGQILATDGSKVYWTSPGAAAVNVSSQYTWTNTHTFTANAIFFNKAGVTIGLTNGGVPNISLGNTVGWYVDASNTFSAIGTSNCTLILRNDVKRIGIGSASLLTDLELSKGVVANGSLGTAGQTLVSSGTTVYWANNTGSTAAVASTAEISGIPPWARQITLSFQGVTSPSANPYVQMGYDAVWLNPASAPGYNCTAMYVTKAPAVGTTGDNGNYAGIAFSYGFGQVASFGTMRFERMGTSNFWAASATFAAPSVGGAGYSAGGIDLGGAATGFYKFRIINNGGGTWSANWS